MLALVYVFVGVLILYCGGEALVRGASHLALKAGISPLIVGLTIVSFSTSMPEAVSSLIAQLRGEPGDLALGNVLGSNIANIGLILGLTGLLCPVSISNGEIRRETLLMIGASLVLAALMLTGSVISRGQGLCLFALLIIYVLYQIWMSRGKREQATDIEQIGRESVAWELLLVVVGVGMLVGGGYLLIDGAVTVARLFGISERVIGLTIVAVGTSLPELATSLVAAARGHHEISIGNIVGSNLFNILCVVGGVAAIRPISFSAQMVNVDLWVMLAFSALLLVYTYSRQEIGRVQAGALLAGYLSYCVYLLV